MIKNRVIKSLLSWLVLLLCIGLFVFIRFESGSLESHEALTHTSFSDMPISIRCVDNQTADTICFYAGFTKEFSSSNFDKSFAVRVESESESEKERILNNIKSLFPGRDFEHSDFSIFSGKNGDYWMDVLKTSDGVFVIGEKF